MVDLSFLSKLIFKSHKLGTIDEIFEKIFEKTKKYIKLKYM